MSKNIEKRKKQSQPTRWGRIVVQTAGAFFLLSLYMLAIFLGLAPSWVHSQFGEVPMDSLLFHIFMPQIGTPLDTYLSFTLSLVVLPLLIVGATLLLPRLLRKLGAKRCASRIATIAVAVMIACGSVGYAEVRLGMVRFALARYQTSSFIEENYVDTAKTSVVFPEKKRNLIFIWAESLEASFQDVANGGALAQNVIAPLTELSKKYTTFSFNDKQGGFFPITTATFTVGGMTVQSSGLPFITPFHEINDTPSGSYMPGATMLGDILQKEGYQNVFLSGTDANFGRQQDIFIKHGNYDIRDLKWMYRTGVVPPGYLVWWGAEDSIVLNTAKTEATRLASQSQPFNLQLELMDTHAPNGYLNAASSKAYGDQYSNVVAGSAAQIKDFVDWAVMQPWADNTTIIVVGDHLTMSSEYIKKFDRKSRRSVYNCFIQAAATPEDGATRKRVATSLDIFPTTLASLGAKIDGDRLALGTNLFSGKPTLAEKFSVMRLDLEFTHRSPFYENKILGSDWLMPPKPSITPSQNTRP